MSEHEELTKELREWHEKAVRASDKREVCDACADAWPCMNIRAADAIEALEAKVERMAAALRAMSEAHSAAWYAMEARDTLRELGIPLEEAGDE